MVSGGKGTAKGVEGSDCYYCSAAVEPLLTERKDSFDAVGKALLTERKDSFDAVGEPLLTERKDSFDAAGEALLTERKDSFDAAGEALLTGQKSEGFLLISCDNEKKKLLLQSV